jgi:hypothetical protein
MNHHTRAPAKADPLWAKPCTAYNVHAELTSECRREFAQAQERLHVLGPGLLCCPPQTLHVSVACFLSVRDDYDVSKDLLWARHGVEWTGRLREIVADLPPFRITFTHLLVTDEAVVAIAQPRDEIEAVRGCVTRMLTAFGLPSFQPSIVHSTLLRYESPDFDHERLRELAEGVQVRKAVLVNSLVISREVVYPSLVTDEVDRLALGVARR